MSKASRRRRKEAKRRARERAKDLREEKRMLDWLRGDWTGGGWGEWNRREYDYTQRTEFWCAMCETQVQDEDSLATHYAKKHPKEIELVWIQVEVGGEVISGTGESRRLQLRA